MDEPASDDDETLPALRDPSDAVAARALAKLPEGSLWRGDEHELRLAAAREAGYEAEVVADMELDLFTEGFKAGMVLDDPSDHAIVLHGRTVLSDKQMSRALGPTLRFLGLNKDQVALRVHDGEFELRVGANAAEEARPVLDSAKLVLRLWLGLGLVGGLIWYWFELAWLTTIIWGGALLAGGYVLRQGGVSGRALLGARLAVALAMLAREEKLILPPSRAPERE